MKIELNEVELKWIIACLTEVGYCYDPNEDDEYTLYEPPIKIHMEAAINLERRLSSIAYPEPKDEDDDDFIDPAGGHGLYSHE